MSMNAALRREPVSGFGGASTVVSLKLRRKAAAAGLPCDGLAPHLRFSSNDTIWGAS